MAKKVGRTAKVLKGRAKVTRAAKSFPKRGPAKSFKDFAARVGGLKTSPQGR